MLLVALIYTYGPSSGAHFNPAVSLGFAVAGALNWLRLASYIAVQAVAAVAAGLFLRQLLPAQAIPSLPHVVPYGLGALGVFLVEAATGCMLMSFILGLAYDEVSGVGSLAPIAIGGVVALLIFATAPLSTGCFNPARALCMCIAASNFAFLPLFAVASPLGSTVGALFWRASRVRLAST